MKFVKTTIFIIASLMVTGCTTVVKFDHDGVLSKKTIGFIATPPPECIGKDKNWECYSKKSGNDVRKLGWR